MVGLERSLRRVRREGEAVRRWERAGQCWQCRREGRPWLPRAEFCIPSTHPEEAAVSSSLARQGARRMGTDSSMTGRATRTLRRGNPGEASWSPAKKESIEEAKWAIRPQG